MQNEILHSLPIFERDKFTMM